MLNNHLVIFGPAHFLREMLACLRSSSAHSGPILYLCHTKSMYDSSLVKEYPQLIYYQIDYIDYKSIDGAAL